MNVYGDLKRAALETIADPGSTIVGRIWWNSTDGQAKLADGTNTRALLRNDAKAVIGNSGTATQNIRLHRGAANVLQFVEGNDATAEGTLSTALNQLSFKLETYSTGSLPAALIAGRLAWDSTLVLPVVHNGTAWKTLVTTDATQTLTNKTFDTNSNTFKSTGASANHVLKSDGSGNTSWGATPVALYAVSNKTANYTVLTSDDVLTGDASGGSFTFTIFTAVGNTGKVLIFKKTDTSANTLTLDPNGTETIDGLTTLVLYRPNEEVMIVSDGANWHVIAQKTHGGKYALFRDEKAAGTDGGTFTQGAWRTRDLNTKVVDEIGVTIASNQFTIPAGTYRIRAEAPALAVSAHKAKLQNITDGSTTLQGTSEYSFDGNASTSRSVITGHFTITGTKTFEIQHQCSVTGSTYSFGASTNFAVNEIFTTVELWKIN